MNFRVPQSATYTKRSKYLWVRYADAEDPTAKVLVKKPIAEYVEQVDPMAAFAGLGIGSWR